MSSSRLPANNPRRYGAGQVVALLLVAVAMALTALSFGQTGASAEYSSTPALPDPFDLSAWEACGDDCIVPQYVCPPGYFIEGAGSEAGCTFSGKADALPSVDPRAECPSGQVAVVTRLLVNDGPDVEPVCTDVTIELFDLMTGPACPDGFTFSGFDEPDFDEPGFEERDVDDAIDESQPPSDISMVAPMAPTPTPAPPLPTDGATQPVPTAAPVAIPIPQPMLPSCINAAGESTPATITFTIAPLPLVPTCPDGFELADVGGSADAPIRTRCVNGAGETVPFVLVEPPPIECRSGEIITDAGTPFARCNPLEYPVSPICPIGYSPNYEDLPDEPDVAPDEIFIIAPTASECLIDPGFAEARAAFFDQNNRYPSSPQDFDNFMPTEVAIGTDDDAQDEAAMTGSPASAAPPAVVAPTTVPLPTAVVVVVPQPTAVAAVVAAPAVVVPAVAAPAPAAPVVTTATTYGFGSTLNSHATTTATKLAHTGSDTQLLGYAALAMIAAGAVFMGTRRRVEIED